MVSRFFYFWLMSLLSVVTLSSSEADGAIRLVDRLGVAEVGDYMVTVQNQSYTVMLVSSKSGHFISMQEITLPGFSSSSINWPQWVEQGAQGHTSWTAYELDLGEGKILRAYSFSCHRWCDMSGANSFLTTLLNLPLEPVPSRQQRRVGPRPIEGQTDRRPLWQPACVIHGRPRRDISLNAFRARWPNDGTDMAGKGIELFLPASTGNFPTYLPYWLQVSGVVGKAQMRVVDAGKGLRTPRQLQPNRQLSFVDSGRLEKGNLHLLLRSTPFLGNYTLLALPQGSHQEPVHLAFSLQPTEEPDIARLVISKQELINKLLPGSCYRFSIRSWQHPKETAETNSPLVLLPKDRANSP